MDEEKARRVLGDKARFIPHPIPAREIVRFWGHDFSDPASGPGGRVTEVRPKLDGFIDLTMHETGGWLIGHDPVTGQQVMVHLLPDVEWISVDRNPDSVEGRGVVA